MTSPAAVDKRRSSIRNYLEMVKIEHSVFALPFAMIGMIYAASGWPGWRTFLLIVLAMVSARSAAMAFNRIVDREIDAKNPRTAARHLPSGKLSLPSAWMFFLSSVGFFLLAAALLNPLALTLAPIALVVMLGYSYTKRFTWLSHFVLGLSLGIAPAAAWVAVTGTFSWTPALWILGVACWTAGFDILYALQDDEFDRQHGLKSIPARFGRKTAIAVSRSLHFLAVALLIGAGVAVGAGVLYYLGCSFAAALLIYEQSLVKANDLRRIDMAFFTLNGYVSIGVFVFALCDVIFRL
jgi:4-hydroxybenzoate polyprenyltransferase